MKPGELVHLAGDVWLVWAERDGHFPRAHAVLITDGDGAIIDTGCGLKLLKQIIDRHHPAVVLNTHTHLDHSAGNFLFTEAQLLVPAEGFSTAGDIDALMDRLIDSPEVQQQWKQFMYTQMGYRPWRPTGSFREGDVIKVGRTRIEPVHTPGHTADHYCFFFPDHGIVVGADIDLSPFGPWYGHPESDIEQFMDSIERLKALKARIFVSSHVPPITSGIPEALEAYKAHFRQREERLVELLNRPMSREEIVEAAIIYGRFPEDWPRALRYFEWMMVRKHLVRLEHQGRVRRYDGRWVRT